MRNFIVSAAVAASLLVPAVASAQPRGDWNWRQRNTSTFVNRGQCQRALVSERNEARRDARRSGYTDARFNQRWSLKCEATRVRGRLVYRIR